MKTKHLSQSRKSSIGDLAAQQVTMDPAGDPQWSPQAKRGFASMLSSYRCSNKFIVFIRTLPLLKRFHVESPRIFGFFALALLLSWAR